MGFVNQRLVEFIFTATGFAAFKKNIISNTHSDAFVKSFCAIFAAACLVKPKSLANFASHLPCFKK